MLRKIVEYVKKIFWTELMPTAVNTLQAWTVKPVKFEKAKVKAR